MERIVIIDKVFDKRTVTSKNGSFEVQPLLLSETEKKITASGAEYENRQSYYVELCGNSASSFALTVGTKVRANLLFSAKESNGRVFQSIKTFYINPVND